MRFEETRKKAESRYKERVRDLEEQVKVSREKMQRGQEAIRQANTMAADSYALAEEILAEIRKKNPEWETRRQEALRVSVLCTAHVSTSTTTATTIASS